VREISGSDITVDCEIVNAHTDKACLEAEMVYTMISLKTGRSEKVPESICEKYLV
jgi:acyl-CoA thioesterase FadM